MSATNSDYAALERIIAGMSEEDKQELAGLVDQADLPKFTPNAGAQTKALETEADITLYGGAAGGGKSALLIGAYLNNHSQGIIFRREAVSLTPIIKTCKEFAIPKYGRYVGGDQKTFYRDDGGTLRFAHMNQPNDWEKYQGNEYDFIAFDEAAQFLRDQVFIIMGWLRSTKEGQRCRMILATNPPTSGDGEWMVEEFAPWLDPLYKNPADFGELRWSILVNGETVWVEEAGEYEFKGEKYTAISRTFIPAKVDDNPYLGDEYKARLRNMPEPLRSKMLHGDFSAGREDHQWQVIPSAWIDAAQERWRQRQGKSKSRMISLSADVALGGKDNTVFAALRSDDTFDELIKIKGVDCTSGSFIALKMIEARQDGAVMSVDNSAAWGSSVMQHFKEHLGVDCYGINYGEVSGSYNKDQTFKYMNVRAEMYWGFREALDPTSEFDIALPPDPKLKAQLMATRWEARKDMIKIESKEEIKKRVGTSPDEADAVVQVWSRRNHGIWASQNIKNGTYVGTSTKAISGCPIDGAFG